MLRLYDARSVAMDRACGLSILERKSGIGHCQSSFHLQPAAVGTRYLPLMNRGVPLPVTARRDYECVRQEDSKAPGGAFSRLGDASCTRLVTEAHLNKVWI